MAQAECPVCMDEIKPGDDVAHGCSRHIVCKPCFKTILLRATRSEAEYPPRCCVSNGTPVFRATNFMNNDEILQFLEKMEEYHTEHARRTYCSNQRCSKFLNPKPEGDGWMSTCKSCQTSTCFRCKQTVADANAHTCSGNVEEDPEFAKVAMEQGYKRCPRCGLAIELVAQCNHMKCGGCRFDFCFICLREWRGWHACPTFGRTDERTDDDFEAEWQSFLEDSHDLDAVTLAQATHQWERATWGDSRYLRWPIHDGLPMHPDREEYDVVNVHPIATTIESLYTAQVSNEYWINLRRLDQARRAGTPTPLPEFHPRGRQSFLVRMAANRTVYLEPSFARDTGRDSFGFDRFGYNSAGFDLNGSHLFEIFGVRHHYFFLWHIIPGPAPGRVQLLTPEETYHMGGVAVHNALVLGELDWREAQGLSTSDLSPPLEPEEFDDIIREALSWNRQEVESDDEDGVDDEDDEDEWEDDEDEWEDDGDEWEDVNVAEAERNLRRLEAAFGLTNPQFTRTLPEYYEKMWLANPEFAQLLGRDNAYTDATTRTYNWENDPGNAHIGQDDGGAIEDIDAGDGEGDDDGPSDEASVDDYNDIERPPRELLNFLDRLERQPRRREPVPHTTLDLDDEVPPLMQLVQRRLRGREDEPLDTDVIAAGMLARMVSDRTNRRRAGNSLDVADSPDASDMES